MIETAKEQATDLVLTDARSFANTPMGLVRRGLADLGKKERKIIQFPEDPIGVIEVFPSTASAQDAMQGITTERYLAKGEISIPLSSLSMLNLSSQNPFALDDLSPCILKTVDGVCHNYSLGSLPKKKFEDYSHLKWLYLGGLQDSFSRDTPDLMRLTNLQGLGITCAAFGLELELLPNTTEFPQSLEYLELCEAWMNDDNLYWLEDLTKIKWLDLACNYINGSGLACLLPMKTLQTLCLDYTDLEDEGMAHISKMKSLRRLELRCTRITPKSLLALLELPALSSLYLNDTKTNDYGLQIIGNMTQLNDLALSNTSITDWALPAIAELQNLRSLSLRNTQISPKGFLFLQRALPNCVIEK
ncbi:MAG: hypothetical protein HOP19_21510 [Acidobacteria bacterium]|nr:hypothetical protein [Acidobacteriota bacterium]